MISKQTQPNTSASRDLYRSCFYNFLVQAENRNLIINNIDKNNKLTIEQGYATKEYILKHLEAIYQEIEPLVYSFEKCRLSVLSCEDPMLALASIQDLLSLYDKDICWAINRIKIAKVRKNLENRKQTEQNYNFSFVRNSLCLCLLFSTMLSMYTVSAWYIHKGEIEHLQTEVEDLKSLIREQGQSTQQDLNTKVKPQKSYQDIYKSLRDFELELDAELLLREKESQKNHLNRLDEIEEFEREMQRFSRTNSDGSRLVDLSESNPK